MTGSARGRTSFSRALLAVTGVALLALLALAALLVGGAFGDRADSSRPEVHGATVTAVGERGHADEVIHAIHQQPSTRARSVAFAVLAAATIIAAWAFRRVPLARAGRLRALHFVGLPPGRAPPAPRIA